MKILLVTDSYPPEIRSASHLMLELAEELQQRGHEISVATTWPQYNLDAKDSNKKFQEYTNENGVNVIRIKTLPHHNTNFIVRGISQLTQPWLFLRKIRKYGLDNVDAVIIYSPPLPLALVGTKLRKQGVKVFLNVQDLFPQNAIDLGILKNKLLIEIFRGIEKEAYRAADVISAHSEGNKEIIAQHYPQFANKLVTLHNWVDVEHHQIDSDIDFKEKFQLHNKFVAVFAGVMGPSQNLDFILNIAQAVKQHSDIVFLFVGDGAEKQHLQQRVETEGLNNVMFKPFISREDYPALLDACDVGLVCLSSKNNTPVVPGKILGYMAAKLPVFACLNKQSDGIALINDAHCGAAVVSNDVDKAVAAFLGLYNDKQQLSQTGDNGFEYVKSHFSKQKCVSEIEEVIQ